MKKVFVFALTVFLFSTIFISCKKVAQVQTTAEKLQQKWRIISIKGKDNGGNTVIINSNTDDFMDFKSDSTVTSFINGVATKTNYYLVNDSQISSGQTMFTILTLDKASLVLASEEYIGSEKMVITYNMVVFQ